MSLVGSSETTSSKTPVPCLVILGRQGSGKGTQSELLEKNLGTIHVSTGDMLREAGDTDIGKRVKDIMEAGELVSDDLMCELVEERLSQSDIMENGVVLDGFPRNPVQAEALKDILANLNLSINIAVNINVDKETAIERMLERGRSDDTQEAIERRLAIYEEQTAPLLKWFENQELLTHIDGQGSMEEVFELLKTSLNGHLG